PRSQAVDALAALAALGHELGLFQDLEVLRDRGERHLEGFGQRARCFVSLLERKEDRASRGVSDRVKYVIVLKRAHDESTPDIHPEAPRSASTNRAVALRRAALRADRGTYGGQGGSLARSRR